MDGRGKTKELEEKEQGWLDHMPEWFRILADAYLKYREEQTGLGRPETLESQPADDDSKADDRVLVVE